MTHNNFIPYSHRGFGEKAYPRYQKDKSFQYVYNYLTGLELGIAYGADALEIDLSKTLDGKIVTAHGSPLNPVLPYKEKDYLERFPEALTLDELFDWLYNQNRKIILYLELKSSITVTEIIDYIESFAKRHRSVPSEQLRSVFYEQIMLYSLQLPLVKHLIDEKLLLGL